MQPLNKGPQPPASRSGGSLNPPTYRKSADIIRGIEIQYHNDTSTNKVDLLVELLKAAILKKHTASSGLFGNHKDRAGVIRKRSTNHIPSAGGEKKGGVSQVGVVGCSMAC